MEKELLFKYNLQFFAEGGNDDPDNDDVDDGSGDAGSGDDNGNSEINAEAFAELISEKDKKIEEQETEIKKLKKANAELTVKLSTGAKAEKTFEENLLGLVGVKPRKE